VTAGEIRRRAERKRLQEKKRGYCECCQIKYENLDKVKIIIIILFNVVGYFFRGVAMKSNPAI